MIHLIYEQNREIGNGHYARCYSIHEALEQDNGTRARLINEKNFVYDNTVGNIYVVDFFDTEKATALINGIKTNNLVCTLDYFSNAAQPDLNISVLEQLNEKRLHCNYLGLKYCIIRKEFFKVKVLENKPQNIFVYIGGSGNADIINNLVGKLGGSPYKIILVRNNNSDVLGQLPENFKVFYMPSDLPELMNNSFMAITSPGLATMELLYLQVPSVLYPLISMHEKFADFLIEQQLAIGRYESFDKVNMTRIERIKQPIKNAIDGKGVQRIIDLLFKHYEQKMGGGYPRG
jgi:spore coat polysaccharide biosynthesis predicted glycosyltransferase SpsG